MIRAIGWAFIAAALGAGPASAAPGVSNVALAQAGRAATLAGLSDDSRLCRPERSVEAWLKELAGKNARSIVWTGGDCQLRNEANPSDAGGKWCAQASVMLAKPKSRADRPMIEIYFEKPTAGKPGKPYAFRGSMITADGPDYMRFSADFESNWRARFTPDQPNDPACD